MSALDEEPVLYRDATALEADPVDDTPRALIDHVERAAIAVGQGVPLDGSELDEMRTATRRLRRAIEVRAITSATVCRSCGEIFIRENAAERDCSRACHRRA